MIIREIAQDPERFLNQTEDFDWFNDYKDTRRYLEATGRTDLIERLDAGHETWLKKERAKHPS